MNVYLSSAAAVAVLLSFSLSPAAEFPPQDHGGANIQLADGDSIWGSHVNVGNFTVPAGATVSIKPYDGDSTNGTGSLELYANNITIDGHLKADGAGYTGGGGGAGVAINPNQLTVPFTTTLRGNPGDGRYGDGLHTGRDGSGDYDPRGAYGDGPVSGYMAGYRNGDYTRDHVLNMGGGGKGGDGVNAVMNWGGGGSVLTPAVPDLFPIGGGGGGCGGGMVRLSAVDSITLNGKLTANGWLGQNGSFWTQRNIFDLPNLAVGGAGGNAVPPEQGLSGAPEGSPGDAGTDGGGGGILLGAQHLTFGTGSKILTRGGAGETVNGGTVKFFASHSITGREEVDIQAGRFYSATDRELFRTEDFEEEGKWEYGDASPTFDGLDHEWVAPQDETGGHLLLRANGTNSFGFWHCGYSTAAPGDPGLYEAAIHLRSTTAERSKVPAFRIRTNSAGNLKSQSRTIASVGDGRDMPDAEGKTYSHLFQPRVWWDWGFRLSFDMIALFPGKDPEGALFIDEVNIYRFDPIVLEPRTRVRLYNFEESAEGWAFDGAANFGKPTYAHETGTLEISVPDNTTTHTFGYVGNQPGDIIINSDQLYMISFTVESDLAEAELENAPGFRCRVNESNWVSASDLQISSEGTLFKYGIPYEGHPQTYIVYHLPTAAANGQSLLLFFDLMHFNPADTAGVTYRLTTVEVEEIPRSVIEK